MADQSAPPRAILNTAQQVVAWPFWRHPAFQITLAALVLASPVIYNARPYPFQDTSTYLQAGYRLIHLIAPSAGEPTSDFMRSYLGARSSVYGLLITLLELAGTLWAIVAFNAVMTASVLYSFTKGVTTRPWAFPILIGVLTIGSALPLFVGFLTPDFAAPLCTLCICALVLFPDRLAAWERGALWGWLTLALWFHASHIIAAFAMLPLFWLAARLTGRAAAQANKTLLKIGAVALAGVALAGIAAMGNPPVHTPPYFTARVLADGPGRLYLREVCAQNDHEYVLCQFRQKPLNYSDTVLWGLKPESGVFAISPQPTRLALIAEQNRFVLNAVARRPLMQIGAALNNAFKQFITIRIDGALAIDGDFWRHLPADFYLADMIRETGCPKTKKLCPSRLDLRVLSASEQMIVILGALYLIVNIVLQRPWRKPITPDDGEYRAFLALLALAVAALVVNAALCGAISGVFPRYQARMGWLIPALAILAELRFPLGTREKPKPA